MHLAERLHNRGWSREEIDHALAHMDLAQSYKHPIVQITEGAVYWLFVFAIIVSTALFSKLFFPFFTLLPIALEPVVFATIGIVGGVFGLLFAHTIHDIEEITHKHHAFAMLIAASAAVLASWVFTRAHVTYGVTFAVSFSILYSFYWWRR